MIVVCVELFGVCCFFQFVGLWFVCGDFVYQLVCWFIEVVGYLYCEMVVWCEVVDEYWEQCVVCWYLLQYCI